MRHARDPWRELARRDRRRDRRRIAWRKIFLTAAFVATLAVLLVTL